MSRLRRGEVEPGHRIGDYVIDARIAIGGFGTIWRARHAETDAVAALKILHGHLVFSDKLVQRFELEARAIAELRHKNIVELYSQGRLDDGRPYFVMEFLEGVDLSNHLASRGTLTPEETLAILEQLAEALNAAHELGIVHRDLKPSNIFLSHIEGELRVVLFDFGIAKLLGHRGPELTASQSLLGSPSCMSPEQIRNMPVDRRTDVYAIGSLTYQMLIGRAPFIDPNPATVLTMHLQINAPSPSLHGDVSPAFDAVVLRAMSKNPGDRYPNAPAFAAAFRGALEAAAGVTRERAEVSSDVHAIGLYVDVGAKAEALVDPDDSMLDDMESIVPELAGVLAERGFHIALENGNSALFYRALPLHDTTELRRVTTRLALREFQRLAHRELRDDRVKIHLYLHVADVRVQGSSIEGGSLLDVTGWTSGDRPEGVYASAAAIHSLNCLTAEESEQLFRVLGE